MVWVCMTAKRPGPIISVDGHVNAKNTLRFSPMLLSLIRMSTCLFLLYISMTMHHATRQKLFVTKFRNWDWKSCHGLPKSPDLNPIENAWKLLKARICTEKCTNKDELWQVTEKKKKE